MPNKHMPASLPQVLEAVKNNALAQVQAYLQVGGEVNACDSRGITPLMVAVLNVEAFDMIHLLVNAGADMDARDQSGRSVIERISIPPEPPETWENGHEAWMYSDECFVVRYLLEQRARKQAGGTQP
jgi:hypothetical protein